MLIHGFTNYGLAWAPQLAALVHSGHRVILPDLYGHGASSPATGICTVSDLAGDMINLLDHLGVGSVIVCGLSLGGMVALQMAVDQPNRISSIIVANSRSWFTGPESSAMVDAWIDLLMQEGRSVEAPARHLADAGQRRIPRERSRPGIVRRLGAGFGDRSRLFTLSRR